MALAVTEGADQDFDGADRVDLDLGHFPHADAAAERPGGRRGRSDAAGLDVAGETDAAELAVLRRFRLPRLDAGVVGGLQRLVEEPVIIAGIVFPEDRGLIGEVVDEVLPAQFGGVDLQFAGRGFHQPLEHERRFRAAGTADGIDRDGVGVDRPDIDVDRRDDVLAGHQRPVEIGRDERREERHVGADIGDGVDLQTENPVVPVEGDLGGGDVIAAVGVGQERLGPVRCPLDDAAGLLRRPEADDLLGIGEDLRAEAAADVGGDDPELVLRRDIDEGGEHDPKEMRVLGGVPERQMFVAGIVLGDHGTRLHGARHRAVVDDIEPGDVRGAGERLLGRRGVAELPVEDQVVGAGFVDLRSAGFQRRRGVHHRRQHVVVDVHRGGCILGLSPGFGDDRQNGLADEAHAPDRQRRVRAHFHRRPILGMDHPAANDVGDAAGCQFLAGMDRDHPRHLRRRSGVDRLDRGVGVRRADEDRMRGVGRQHVVGIPAGAGDEALVLLAKDAGADAVICHGAFPPICRFK